jgi:hypothetical protein
MNPVMKLGSKPWGWVLGLLGVALVGCGADVLTASTPLPPLITSSDIPSVVNRNGFLELGVSVSVPGRIPAELAFQVSWSGIEVQTLSAAQVNCVSGEVSLYNPLPHSPSPELGARLLPAQLAGLRPVGSKCCGDRDGAAQGSLRSPYPCPALRKRCGSRSHKHCVAVGSSMRCRRHSTSAQALNG